MIPLEFVLCVHIGIFKRYASKATCDPLRPLALYSHILPINVAQFKQVAYFKSCRLLQLTYPHFLVNSPHY